MSICIIISCCCGGSTEESQGISDVEGVQLILIPQCTPPQFDVREQVLLDSNGANEAYLNPQRLDKVFAFLIDGGTTGQISNYLRNSPQFPRLAYFEIGQHAIKLNADGSQDLCLSEFFQRHRDTLTFVDIEHGSIQICDELERALNHLPQLRTLRVMNAVDMRTLLRGMLPELKSLVISFYKTNQYDFSVSAPNLETCYIAENGTCSDGTNNIDLRNAPNLVKVAFSAASEERKLILPERDSQLRWLSLGTKVNVTGDLSQLVVLEIACFSNVDVNPLLDVCKSSLRELCLNVGKNAVIDASIRLNVLRLSEVKNARVITAASTPLELLTMWDSTFSENQESIYAKRVWLSSSPEHLHDSTLRLKETVYLGAHIDSSKRWTSDFEAVIRGVAAMLKVLSISPMLALPSFQTLEFVCLPTHADFIREKEQLGKQLKAIAVTSEPSEPALRQLRDTVCPNVEWIRPSEPLFDAEFDLEKRLFDYLNNHAVYVTNTASRYVYIQL